MQLSNRPILCIISITVFFLIPHVIYKPFSNLQFLSNGGRRARDRMVVGLTTTCLISTYHH